MTWSYSLATLNTSPKDQVRLLIGDTVVSDQQFQDEELYEFLNLRSNAYGAAAEALRALASQYSRSADYAAGSTVVKYSQMAKAYAARAQALDAKAAMGGSGLPYAGGISISDKQQGYTNTDNVGPQFVRQENDDQYPVGESGSQGDADIYGGV